MDKPAWLAAIQHRDPSGVALRRATRIAVIVPLALLLLLNIPVINGSALFGVFATLALLLFADFGGPLLPRAVAYVTTTAAGVPILYLGIELGQSVIGAVAVMFSVTVILGILAVLRGVLAAAQSTLLLATVLAVTSAQAGTQWQVIACWLLGGLIALGAALLLWPARPSKVIRRTTARVLAGAAEAVRARWCAPADPARLEAAVAQMDADLAELRKHLVGNLLRPSGLTSRDRAMAELVDCANRMRRYQRWVDVTPPAAPAEPELERARSLFAEEVAGELEHISQHLLDERTETFPEAMQQARERNLDEISAWAQEARHRAPAELLRQRLDDLFPLRLSSVTTELASATAGARHDFHDRTLGDELERPRRGVATRLQAHLSWHSPWFRNALRAAVALGLSVAIAKTLALGHEFWIVLGTLTALRFDALGTGRTAVQALFGTTVGVLLASGLILVFADNTAVWWVLLPPTLFIAAFTPGTFSLMFGQAAFSLVVLVLFSLLYPATLATAELRLVDVFIGLCVSLFISLVMWPRGVVATLYQRMQEAMTAASDHLVMAMDHVAGGAVDRRILRDYSRRSADAVERAQEAYDLSVAQQPPSTVPLQEWSRVGVATRHVDIAAHLIPGIQRTVTLLGADRTVPSELVGPFLDTSQDLRDRLRGAVETWHDLPPPGVDQPTSRSPDDYELTFPESVTALRSAIVRWLGTPSDWALDSPDPRPATVAWLADWTAFISWNADLLQRDLVHHTA